MTSLLLQYRVRYKIMNTAWTLQHYNGLKKHSLLTVEYCHVTKSDLSSNTILKLKIFGSSMNWL